MAVGKITMKDGETIVNAMARITFALWHAVDAKAQGDTYIHPDMGSK